MQCITMKATLNLILASTFMGVFYEATFCQNIPSGFTLINRPYTFPGNASGCEHTEWRKRPPTDATIATYRNHKCMTEKGFEEEFTCKDHHLLLKSAKYTDQGPYEFICNGVKTSVQLDVLYALNVSVEETDSITLNCYAHNTKDVTWLHNNKRVLHYKLDGSVNPGKGYEGRASLEKNGFKTGDFSLTIPNVSKADAGIYRCFVDDETAKGNPHAYLLHVNEKRSSPGDQTHPNCNEATLVIYKTSTIVLGLILGLIVVSAIYWITIKLHNRQSTPVTATLQKSEENTTENKCLLMSDICTTSSANERQPVQESDATENKHSNTKPIF
ncbi:uncharacterized protein LOC107688999 isoform X2 [Sinocyclocheilus anshuiensis]|uniref:uncharacterized protein LOC107688999 isoform X2 n=1 Tax=Sinocyclocheilus anshuiensis TaxID=1608454 RepID=UPI0007BA5BCC|nr:PREDICTED: uncharacterized protein LOC107688999 isoform X2 [Sinocyclocheilus anshuiensis]